MFTFKGLLAFTATALLLAQKTTSSPLVTVRDETTQDASAAPPPSPPPPPPPPPADPTDEQILNFALTLEHLENAFYNEALGRFDQGAFERAGFPAFARGRFNQIKNHETTHVQHLTDALGGNAVQPCTYKL